MANNTLTTNIGQAVNDFTDIKSAIIEKTVEVPGGTPTSGYGNLIRQMRNTPEETPATIKQKYESNADTNAFTDAEKSKLANLENQVNTAIGTHNTDADAHLNLRSKHKQAVLATTGWVADGRIFRYTLSDSDINEYNTVVFKPANESEDTWIDGGVYSYGSTANGVLNIYSRQKPTANITLYYSIIN